MLRFSYLAPVNNKVSNSRGQIDFFFFRHTERNANLDSEDEEETIIPKSKPNQRRRRSMGSLLFRYTLDDFIISAIKVWMHEYVLFNNTQTRYRF